MGRPGLCQRHAREAGPGPVGGGGPHPPRAAPQQLLRFPARAEPRPSHQRVIQEGRRGEDDGVPVLREQTGAEEVHGQALGRRVVRGSCESAEDGEEEPV